MKFGGRKRGESRRAWRAFLIYLELPQDERTTQGVLDSLGRTWRRPGQVARWAERFDWDERVLAHARRVEELDRLERIHWLSIKAADLGTAMVTPFLDALARYDSLIAQGEGNESKKLVDAMYQVAVALPLAKEALLLTGKAEHAEVVFQARQAFANADRARFMTTVAGPGPAVADMN